jgi:hypothetical protein
MGKTPETSPVAVGGEIDSMPQGRLGCRFIDWGRVGARGLADWRRRPACSTWFVEHDHVRLARTGHQQPSQRCVGCDVTKNTLTSALQPRLPVPGWRHLRLHDRHRRQSPQLAPGRRRPAGNILSGRSLIRTGGPPGFSAGVRKDSTQISKIMVKVIGISPICLRRSCLLVTTHEPSARVVECASIARRDARSAALVRVRPPISAEKCRTACASPANRTRLTGRSRRCCVSSDPG